MRSGFGSLNQYTVLWKEGQAKEGSDRRRPRKYRATGKEKVVFYKGGKACVLAYWFLVGKASSLCLVILCGGESTCRSRALCGDDHPGYCLCFPFVETLCPV